MANYINEGINVVNFTEITYLTKQKDDGTTSEYAKITTTNAGDGAINNNFIFPYRFWDQNKDQDGKVKNDTTQQKEWNEALAHIFGAAVPTEVYDKAITGKTTFKDKIEAIASICTAANGGGSFRMKFVSDKTGKFATWNFRGFGVAEKTTVALADSKLKFVHAKDSKAAKLKKIAEKAVTTSAPQVPAYSNDDLSDSLPF